MRSMSQKDERVENDMRQIMQWAQRVEREGIGGWARKLDALLLEVEERG
jgi:hypothetical protein